MYIASLYIYHFSTEVDILEITSENHSAKKPSLPELL